MKTYTSAALLALKLTWKTVLLTFTLTLGLQIFDGYRELMPGGVPLQVSFGFENLLRAAAQPAGKWWTVMLLVFLTVSAGRSKGSRSVYTVNRLGLCENHTTLIFGLVFTGYFLLYWALQIAVCYGFYVWHSRLSLISSNTFVLACWRSEWLHILLPLNEWWNYLRNLAICGSFGFAAAFGSQLLRRGKFPVGSFVPPLLCMAMLSGRIVNFAPDLALTVLLTVCTAGYYFVLKGGREDEDL